MQGILHALLLMKYVYSYPLAFNQKKGIKPDVIPA